MTPPDATARLSGLPDARPLIPAKDGWIRLAGPAASLLILIAVAYQLRTIELQSLVNLLPFAPAFWICFIAYYLAGPLSEFVIFRRLWSLPPSGLSALLRKLVSNELLLGYSGELYFYAWARRHARIAAAPFGAIKDVTILSAVIGNLFCLLMVALAWSLLASIHLGVDRGPLILSACVVLVPSVAAMLFRRRLFTLPRQDLWFIAFIHAGRIVAMTVLAAIMWHMLLPTVALNWWLVLAAIRQLISRLPLLPNKDVAFAGLASILVGGEGQIAIAMTLMASLLLFAHLCVGAFLSTAQLAQEVRR
jgi:hypothetical protein